jgi:hypothetical protein
MSRQIKRKDMAKKKQTKDQYHWAQYEVSLDYRKPDGYWVVNHLHPVKVRVHISGNEKNKHAEAEAIARRDFPRCRINSVTYC